MRHKTLLVVRAAAAVFTLLIFAGGVGAAPVEVSSGIEFASGTLTAPVWDGLVGLDRNASGHLILWDSFLTTATLSDLARGEAGAESDPIFAASVAADITASSVTQWNAGGGASVPDPIVPADGTQDITGNMAVSGAVSGTSATLPMIFTDGLFSVATVGENVNAGQPLYRRSDGVLMRANALSSATMPAVALAMEAITSGTAGSVLRFGLATLAGWTWQPGEIVWVSADAPGVLSTDRPTSSGCMVQIVGTAESATTVWVTLSPVMVELD